MKYLLIIPLIFVTTINAQTAKEIVEKADQLMRANSSYSEIEMTIQKGDQRRIEKVLVTRSLRPETAQEGESVISSNV